MDILRSSAECLAHQRYLGGCWREQSCAKAWKRALFSCQRQSYVRFRLWWPAAANHESGVLLLQGAASFSSRRQRHEQPPLHTRVLKKSLEGNSLFTVDTSSRGQADPLYHPKDNNPRSNNKAPVTGDLNRHMHQLHLRHLAYLSTSVHSRPLSPNRAIACLVFLFADSVIVAFRVGAHVGFDCFATAFTTGTPAVVFAFELTPAGSCVLHRQHEGKPVSGR